MNRFASLLILWCLAPTACVISAPAFADPSEDKVLARIEALEKKNNELVNANAALRVRVSRLESSRSTRTGLSEPPRQKGSPTAASAEQGEFHDGQPASFWQPRFEGSATLLYLQPGGGNLQFGTLVTPLPLPSPNWANQSLDPKLSPAFRVGFAYLPTPSDDVEVDWTHLSSGANSSFAGSPTQMVGPPFLIGPGADSYKRGQGDASFAYDSVTADGGHTFCAACAFQLQVFAGLEFARIGQNVGGTFESYDGSNTSGYTNSSLFTGIGPRMGTKAQYDVGNFQFAGELAAAALVGRSQGQINFATYSTSAGSGIPEPNNQSLTSPNATQVVPAVEANLNVAYAFPPTAYGQLKLELGYQAAVYSNAINQYSLTQVATPPVVGTVGVFLATQQHLLSDFTVQGPYASAKLEF